MARVLNAWFGSAFADALVAGFAALAVAFVAWAMPGDIFSDLVGASGLAAIVPAAQPPLGETARLLTMAALAGGVFTLLFGLLRLIGMRPSRARTASFAVQGPVAPRVRRADAHPDAPSRAPILAMAELGTPIPPPPPEPEEPYTFYTSHPEPAEIAEAADVLVLGEPFALEPEPEATESAAAAPPPVRGNESLSELMRRLEQGLTRLGVAGEPPRAAAEPAVRATDDRLRHAIEDLQRMAARR